MDRQKIEKEMNDLKSVSDNLGLLRFAVKHEKDILEVLKTEKDRKIFVILMKQVKSLFELEAKGLKFTDRQKTRLQEALKKLRGLK
jgi:hypothetical protein